MDPVQSIKVGADTIPAAKPRKKIRKVQHILIAPTAKSSESIFEFEELPAEIRTEIHGLTLIATGPITVTRRKGGRCYIGTRGREVVEWYIGASVAVGDGAKRRRLAMGDVHELAVLQVSRQIYAEARAFLYANNRFQFATVRTFDAFTNQIGSIIKLLTNLELSYEYLCRRDDVLLPLRAASRLGRVQITLRKWDTDLDRVATGIWDAIRSFVRRARRESGGCIDCTGECVCMRQEQKQRRFDYFVYAVLTLHFLQELQSKSAEEQIAIVKAAVQGKRVGRTRVSKMEQD